MPEEYEKVQPPQGYNPAANADPDKVNIPEKAAAGSFGIFPPSQEDAQRVADYRYYKQLFMGQHFDAFRIRISDEDFNKAYARLRYITVNFAGLLSKIVADMLFSEPIAIKVPNGDQEFVDELVKENNLHVKFYESALSNSYYGDTLFKVRVGKKNPEDKKTIPLIETVPPTIYYPELNPFNIAESPKRKILAWEFTQGSKKYVRREIHIGGIIENEFYELSEGKLIANVTEQMVKELGIKQKDETKIERSTLMHIVNWKTIDRHFGISDYIDLEAIFFSINNRFSKNDNILDKHGDPILMVPPGILDEKGQVRKKALGVIEMGEGEDGKPEYVVWDAKLEAAMSQIEKLIEMFYLVAEVSPDILGMGKDVSASGRAMKYKLLRTIAKVARKKLYYDQQIKEAVYVAQLLAKAHGLEINGKKLQKEAVVPDIVWEDGLPVDQVEQTDLETKKIESGIQSKKQAIMVIDGIDEKAAEKKLEEIEEEKPKIEIPGMNPSSNPFKDDEGDDMEPGNGKINGKGMKMDKDKKQPGMMMM